VFSLIILLFRNAFLGSKKAPNDLTLGSAIGWTLTFCQLQLTRSKHNSTPFSRKLAVFLRSTNKICKGEIWSGLHYSTTYLSFDNDNLLVGCANVYANYFLPRRASSSSRSMCLLCDGTPTRINSSI
jgi:hypothetical protein